MSVCLSATSRFSIKRIERINLLFSTRASFDQSYYTVCDIRVLTVKMMPIIQPIFILFDLFAAETVMKLYYTCFFAVTFCGENKAV